MSKSYVHLYTGEGKGKTSAAAGLAARALGQGLRVGFFQFLKSGACGISGEVVSLAKLGAVTVSPETPKFVWDMDEEEKAACRKQQQETLARAAKMAESFDLLVLDEAVCALTAGMLTAGELCGFIENRPPALELVLTGRGDIEPLRGKCDYITEMKLHSHPFVECSQGPRRGIEF